MILSRFNATRLLRQCFCSAANSQLHDPSTSKPSMLTLRHIEEVIEKQPQLRLYDHDRWHRTHDTLVEQGFSTATFVHIITTIPALLNRQPEQILKIIECWRSTQFGDRRVLALLEQYPELFNIKNEHTLTARVAYLKPYALTDKNIWSIFMNAPNIVNEREPIIAAKIKYLQNTMRADIPDVVKSTVFSHSLEGIRCRHVFLDRLGLYKPRHPKAGPLEPTKNPRMHQIYDTTDAAFASKICGVSPEEFEVFQKLYEVELEKSDEEDGIEDDDIDY